MTSTEYIKKMMLELVVHFPSIRVRYDHHLLSNTHTLEVVPNNLYHLDERYKSLEEELLFDFIDKYPGESLSFVTDDSVFGIDKIDDEEIGVYYNSAPTALPYSNIVYQILNGQSINDLFKNYKVDFYKNIHYLYPFSPNYPLLKDISCDIFTAQKLTDFSGPNSDLITADSNQPEYDNLSQNDYILAA